MRVLIAALVAALASVSVSAQQVERTVDLASLGWGQVDATPVDTDGNDATEEWLVQTVALPPQYRVVAVRPSGMCAGPWFQPSDGMDSVALVEIGGVSKLKLTRLFAFGVLRIVSLTTPAC